MYRVLVPAAALAACSSASAAIVAKYEFGQGLPQTVAPNVTATAPSQMNLSILDVNRTSTGYANGPSNPFLAVCQNATSQLNAAQAYAGNHYWSVTLAAHSGYSLDLDSLSFLVFRGGASGIRGFAVYSSVDSFSAPLVQVNDETGTRAAPRTENITLSSAFDDLTTPVTFRFYVHTPNNATTMEFDDVTFDGSVNVVPEPASFGSLLLGGLLLRRRRS